MKKVLLCLAPLLIFAVGCSTTKCGGYKDTSGDAVVTVVKDQNMTISSVLKAAGGAVNIQGTSLSQMISDGADDDGYSKDERAAIVAEVQAEAESYVKSHSKRFCNECTSGDACQAKLHGQTLKLVSSQVAKDVPEDGKDTITLRFKFEGRVSCEPCVECQVMLMSVASKSGAPSGGSLLGVDEAQAACEGSQRIEIDGEMLDPRSLGDLE